MDICNALRPMQTGANLTAAAASTSVAIPMNGAGLPARYIRVTPTALCECHVRIGKGAQTALDTDMLVTGTAGGVILDSSGCDTIAVIQRDVGGIVNVAPMDWA